jgi:hypothetical protein
MAASGGPLQDSRCGTAAAAAAGRRCSWTRPQLDAAAAGRGRSWAPLQRGGDEAGRVMRRGGAAATALSLSLQLCTERGTEMMMEAFPTPLVVHSPSPSHTS